MANTAAIPNAVPTIIDSVVTAPVTGNQFVFQLDPAGSDFSAVFVPTGTVTTITAQLEISLDGGITWQIYITTANFFPTNATLTKTVTPMIAGALFRITYTAASGSIVMRVCAN